MLLSSQTPQIYSYLTLGISIIVLMVAYLILRNGDLLMEILAHPLCELFRLMGLILLVIAVQFVIDGTVSIIKPLIF